MHIAETREKAYADTEFGFHEWIDYTHDIVPAPPGFPRGVANPAQFCNDSQLGIVGTPDDAIREIERVRQKLGGMGAVLVFGNDLAPWPAQQRSFELLAEFVKPHFTGANRARQASYDWTAQRQVENRQKAQSAVASATDEFAARRAGGGRGDD